VTGCTTSIPTFHVGSTRLSKVFSLNFHPCVSFFEVGIISVALVIGVTVIIVGETPQWYRTIVHGDVSHIVWNIDTIQHSNNVTHVCVFIAQKIKQPVNLPIREECVE
jgi:hypothetical protein